MEDNGLVNDAFWLAFAKDYVSKAISSRDDAAAKLETFLTAIWAIYTPLLAAGIAFDLISDNIISRIFMSLPVLIVPFARFVCIDVQLPVSVEFFPNEVNSIEFDCYAKVLKNKSYKLKWAVFSTIIAILSIAAALFIYKISSPADNYKNNTSFNPDAKDVHVIAKIDPLSDYTITVIWTKKADATHPSIKSSAKLKSDAKGNIDQLVPVDGLPDNIKTIIEWTDKGKSKIISSN